MDAKDLRTESVLGERSSDGTSKYSHMGTTLSCSVNKNYPEISSNPLAKVDTPTSRPCAVIGPDRVLPPPTNSDAYLKKGHYEPWPPTESTFRHPPEYPHKTYQSPIRNISPRQTFQENMQRIMVAPTYNSMKMNEETNFGLDRNAILVKNKLSSSAEPKYCEVPYSINHISENPKNPEMCFSNVNNVRNCPPIWHPSGVNIRPARPYGASELYQFTDYASCAGPRPMTMARPPHRTVNDESNHLYSEGYYHHGNVRFKPYPNIKERYPQARYDYINNYPNPFHPPPPFPPHKYDLHKAVPSHPSYPQVPIKYVENRMNDSVIDGYQRPNQQINYNAPYQNQMLHPAYGPVLPNGLQGKLYPYPQDKTVAANKLPYENNSKMYLDYENSRNKGFPDNFYVNDISRSHMKSQVIMPNYPSMNLPPHPYYRKDHLGKGYDYMPHYRNVDPNINTNHLTRMTPQFSPNGIAISPSDSNTSNDTAHTHGNSLEDCGYVSQSSTASARSIESGVHRIIPNDIHRRYNYGYPSMVRASALANKVPSNIHHSTKDKKGIDVRQFLQMWNEGDDENVNAKESQIDFSHNSNKSICKIEAKTQEQLYVLGLVNVPSEELGKYEHIQKVSKLPENIKGYNNIELLKHFEEAIESSNLNNVSKTSTPRNYPSQRNPITAGFAIPARPISPLDVEAKISQSVIHKEVGCNFEIRPCSPEMLNVEVATPVQNILEERVIEKVSNPYQSPAINNISDNGRNCNVPKQDHVIMINENVKIPSCKLINTQCLNSDVVNAIRPDYCLQDLESNSGVCLASLPRLDNDIELNFPEVNQQFIDDNKESVITPKDLQSSTAINTSNYKNDDQSLDHSYKTTLKETEKEFSKLSKYRKNKKLETETTEHTPITSSQFLRTDSVIIKNPDNAKYLEDSTEHSSSATNIEKEQNDVLNLSPTLIIQNNHVKNNDNTLFKEPDNDIAIDFSLHKNKSIFDSKIVDEDNYKSCINDIHIDKTIQSNDDIVDNCPNALTISKTTTDDDDCTLTKVKNNNKKCLENIEVNPSDKISDNNTQQSVESVAKEVITQKESEEPVLCITSLESLSKNLEEKMIFDNEDEIDVRKKLENFDKDSLDQDLNIHVETEKKGTTSNCNSYSPATELDEVDEVDRENSHKSDLISIEAVNQNVNYQFPIVSSQRITEEINISNDNISMNRISQNSAVTCHSNSLANSDYESEKISSDLATDSVNNGRVVKSCNLRKNLFSPFIQKLILKSDDSILKSKLINEKIIEVYLEDRIEASPIIEYSNSSSIKESVEGRNHSSSVTDNTGSSNISDKCNMSNDRVCAIEEIKEKHVEPIQLPNSGKEKFANLLSAKSDKNKNEPINLAEQKSNDHVCAIEEIKEKNVETIELPNSGKEIFASLVSAKSDENKKEPINLAEQNDGNQSADSSQNIPKAFFQSCEDIKSNFDDQKELTSSPNISTGVSSVIYENDNEGITITTEPNKLAHPSNISIKDLNDGCKVEYKKDSDSRELIEICHSASIPESMPTEDYEKSSFSTQTEADDLSKSPKLTCSKKCTDENQIQFYLNEQNALQISLTEDANNVDSEVLEGDSKIETLKVNQVQEAVVSKSILKNLFNDSDDLNSQNKSEIEAFKYSQVHETTDSKTIFKDMIEGSGESEIKNKIESLIEPIIAVSNDNSENHYEITKENIDDTVDLSEKSKRETEICEKRKPKTDRCVQETEVIDKVIHKNSEDFDRESIRENGDFTETHKVIQILESESEAQTTSDCISLTEPINSPNIVFETKNNISSDDCIIIDKDEKPLLEKFEVINSPKTSNSETTNEPCNVDSNLSILREGNNTDECFNSSSSKTVIEENVADIQDTTHHTIVLTDNQSTSRLLENICFLQNSSNDINPQCENYLKSRRRALKRSLSDSALDIIIDSSGEFGKDPSIRSKKRRKNNEFLKICDSNFVTDNVSNLQNNRRNSISSVYNEENLSFCIVIDDDCIITQENEDKFCFAEVADDIFPAAEESDFNHTEIVAPTGMLLCTQRDSCDISEPFVLEISEENAFQESWVDDIGCVETVVSDDIAEDVSVSAPSSPHNENALENDTSDVFKGSYGHTDKVKHIYGGLMCNDDAEFVETLFRTPQMNVNKTLSNRESHADDYEELDEYNSVKKYSKPQHEHSISEPRYTSGSLDNRCAAYINNIEGALDRPQTSLTACEDLVSTEIYKNTNDVVKTQDDTVNSCESSIDNVFLYNQGNDCLNFETQSSPEVSSTTSEEKCSSILLKITNYKGTRTSQLNEINVENNSSNCCKFTENINYTSLNNSSTPRPLITKGAQKYIPPLIEPAGDLKVKLPLPQQSLLKLKQLKIAKTMSKQSSSKINDICKKPKPRFEDVLKSIDEIQFKMHKEKSKRPKKSVPKVVIKKSENGSHYASMPNKTYFNPDLTGRKWQPWVFIEKDNFIDKMAIRKKTKAIFSHRKKTYVLADQFQKYKSASSAKFIISQPKLNDQSMGHLKYTIKLKHTY